MNTKIQAPLSTKAWAIVQQGLGTEDPWFAHVYVASSPKSDIVPALFSTKAHAQQGITGDVPWKSRIVRVEIRELQKPKAQKGKS